jgi:molybdopterin-binding protein
VVTRLVSQGALVRVEVDCGVRLIALVTRPSADELGLVPGRPVSASVKASAIHLIPHEPSATPPDQAV